MTQKPRDYRPLASNFYDPQRQKISDAGVNGSITAPAKDTDTYYQVKPPSATKRGMAALAKMVEAVKKKKDKTGKKEKSKVGVIKDIAEGAIKVEAKGATDYENLGEFIAAQAGRRISERKGSQVITPEVFLVQHEKGISVASKFIPDFKSFGDLSKTAMEAGGFIKDPKNPPELRNVTIDFNSNGVKITERKDKKLHSNYGIADDPELKSGLSEVTCLNIAWGNHDNNGKGNAGKSGSKAAGIDFGHAFGSLTNGTKYGGGKQYENGVLDYINRDKLVQFPTGITPKLWRDYKGMIPSEEFAAALIKTSGYGTEIKEGFQEARNGLLAYAESLGDDPKKHQMLIKSLNKLNTNSGHKPIKEGNVYTVIRETLTNLENDCQKRLGEMKEVGQTMQLQTQIDHCIKHKKPFPMDLQTKYNEVAGDKKEIQWVRTSLEDKPIKGDLGTYITERQKQIQKEKLREVGKESVDLRHALAAERPAAPTRTQSLTTERRATQQPTRSSTM